MIAYPEFLQECVDFKKRPLAERQEVWVVHFWASWHGPSQEQISELKGIFNSYRNKPVRFVSVSVDKLVSNWRKALRQHNMPWEQVNVVREADYDFLKRAFKHNSLPAIFVVDQDGLVRRLREINDLQSFLVAISPRLPDRPYYPQTAEPDEPNTPDPGGEEWIYHTVEAGETLYGLYRKYGVSVAEIKALNGLEDNTISIGQKLKIRKR
jgi:thiol-disulfide isomerase/thioredoxin